MDKRFCNDAAPLVKNMAAWNALMMIINHLKEKTANKLAGKPTTEELLRLSGEYNMLLLLEKQQDNILFAEKDL
jgi:hypothetical protein